MSKVVDKKEKKKAKNKDIKEAGSDSGDETLHVQH